MQNNSSSTSTMTGQLALFFSIASLVIGFSVYAIFAYSLQWSEDRVGERRILIDRDLAVELYRQGKQGILVIDALTTAYDDITLVPDNLKPYIVDRQNYVGETETDANDRMVYVGEHLIGDKIKTIYLINDIDTVEFTDEEFFYAVSLAVGVIGALLLFFGVILYRLSQRLISPINTISEQLKANSGNTEFSFSINSKAAVEFQHLATQLNNYRDEIDRLLKREQAFARYASHELRTPLTIIRGANKLLQKRDKTDFQIRQLTRIDDASNHMTAMVDALLSLVRYEKHGEATELREFSEKELRNIVDINTHGTLNKQIPIEINVYDLPSVRATPAIMNMVIGNLIRNAVAATNEGKIEIFIDQNKIEILDEGEGLATEPTDSSASQSDGHGLGLIIVDELCHRYGWQFTLENRISRGCSAKIVF